MGQEPRILNLALIGFGHVGRAFARLLLDRRAWFLREFGLEWKITAIATLRHGMCIDPNGLALGKILRSWKRGSSLERYHNGPACASTIDFVRQCGADVLFELSILDLSGEPAASYIREALRAGLHVVTTNKGPAATCLNR